MTKLACGICLSLARVLDYRHTQHTAMMAGDLNSGLHGHKDREPSLHSQQCSDKVVCEITYETEEQKATPRRNGSPCVAFQCGLRYVRRRLRTEH